MAWIIAVGLIGLTSCTDLEQDSRDRLRAAHVITDPWIERQFDRELETLRSNPLPGLSEEEQAVFESSFEQRQANVLAASQAIAAQIAAERWDQHQLSNPETISTEERTAFAEDAAAQVMVIADGARIMNEAIRDTCQSRPNPTTGCIDALAFVAATSSDLAPRH